ncbi:hypothetical protein [Halovivax gelatinilyticus]|uniref:hypothetical protein n=1 Tax=Halovivax gelatinilyticus TaxID=2961597 RepID=UPI0020CA581B|nr:hypothetical protein [Halovivax gelatinilyticus]
MLEAAIADALDDDWKRQTVVGGGVVAVALLPVAGGFLTEPWLALGAIVPALVLLGYATRVLATPVGDAVPVVSEWAELSRATVRGTLVVAGLVAVPPAVIAFVLGLDVFGNPVPAFAPVWLTATLAGVASVLGAYLAPATLAVDRRRIRSSPTDAGGTVSTVSSIATSRDYVVATLQAVLLWFTALASGVMLLVTVFGLLLVPGVLFVALVVVSRRYAYAVDRVLDPASVESREDISMPGF